MQQDLKSYTVALIKNRIVDVHTFVAQRDGKWILTKEFAGLQVDTTFNSEIEAYDRIATGLVSQYQSGNGLRMVS